MRPKENVDGRVLRSDPANPVKGRERHKEIAWEPIVEERADRDVEEVSVARHTVIVSLAEGLMKCVEQSGVHLKHVSEQYLEDSYRNLPKLQAKSCSMAKRRIDGGTQHKRSPQFGHQL